MGVTILLLGLAVTAIVAAVALARLDHHLEVVNKIDLQATAAEAPSLTPLLAALKEPVALQATLRLVQIPLLAVAVAALAPLLPAGAGRGLTLVAITGGVVAAVALSRRSTPERAVAELPYFAAALAPLWPGILPLLHLERLLGGRRAGDRHLVYLNREELDSLRDLDRFRHEETPDEEAMIGRIFDLKETEVSQIMVPIVDVVAVEEKQTVAEAIQVVNRTRFSRFPVLRHRIYNIVGILNAFDLLAVNDDRQPVSTLTQPPFYVPETMTADLLLDCLRERQIHLAVVVDEYGGATGIVTAEDVIEELVGEITDEHDVVERSPITALQGGGWRVEARLTLDELEEETSIELVSQQYDTVAGFLLEQFHRIPVEGERLQLPELRITIRAASEREIRTVDLEPIGR
ncbi:MAG: HlyC/CorC family transporter [Deltaproteobacteria bacterium]|nr:HlyC/CorC family transporter [Deltaproteobacteria bacterium]NCS73865.1 HlyC/CorC family transporter [Deltaproteobacteria bacterium]OIP65037.1 MAG: hypothetical protein AUK30_05340 [Nitrospirae bacterium CG2_30_70_394]